MRPVVQIGLMVAITVILACVLAAFVFGMIGNSPRSNISGNDTPIREETFRVSQKIHAGDSYSVIKGETNQQAFIIEEDYDKIRVGEIYSFEVYNEGFVQVYKVNW